MSHVLKQARSSDNPAGRAERHKHKRRDPLSNLECKHRLYKKVGLIELGAFCLTLPDTLEKIHAAEDMRRS